MTRTPEKEEAFWSYKNPIVFGLLGTTTLGFTYWYLGSSRSCQKGVCQTNYEHFLASSPNEVGDTLAGIAGVLAFLWIIVTVFLQSRELREARREYEKMADAQQEQVKLLVKQGEIFNEEQAFRRSEQIWRTFDERLQVAMFQIEAIPVRCKTWQYAPFPPSGMVESAKANWVKNHTRNICLFENAEATDSSLTKLAKWSRELHFKKDEIGHLLAGQENERGMLSKASRYLGYPSIVDHLKETIASKDLLMTDAHRIRFEGLGLEKLLTDLEQLLDENEIWTSGLGILPP